MPKVSVVIPNYNHARFLDRRLQSVLGQSFQDIEVIILDDCSTDASLTVLEKYSSHPRVKCLVRNEANTGIPFKQWNKGVSLAQGSYVWIAESDDFADPGLLARLVPLLDEHPGVGVAYCQSFAVSEDGSVISSLKGWTDDLDPDHWSSDYISEGKVECARYIVLKCTIPNASGALFRRSVYEEVGGADESFRLSGDWMLWAKLMIASDVAFVAEPLNFFRMHSNTVRGSSRKSAIALHEAARILCYIRERVSVPADIQDNAVDRLISRWVTELSIGRRGISENLAIYNSLRKVRSGVLRQLIRRGIRRLVGSRQAADLR